MRAQPRAAFQRTELVAEQREVAGRRDRDVFHPQAPRRRVAGVGEQAKTGLALPAIERVKRGERHVDLAPYLDHTRNPLPAQPLRYFVNGAEVLRHVFTGDAVAACGAADEDAVFVLQRDGETVHLRFGNEGDGAGHDPLRTFGPRGEFLVRERVVERQHRDTVVDGRERRRRLAAGTLRRRVGDDERRVLGLEGAKLAHEGVELGVGDLRFVLEEIAIVVVLDLGTQRAGAFHRLLRDLRRGHASNLPRGYDTLIGEAGSYAPTVRRVAAAWSWTRAPISRASRIACSACVMP